MNKFYNERIENSTLTNLEQILDKIVNPPNSFRCAPFWSWNDLLNEDELVRQIQEMHEKGWGGFFMHSRVGLVTEYLSDEWFELINTCTNEAEKRGLYAWLYDEDKWPSGYAGGKVPSKSPEYRHKFIALVDKSQLKEDDIILAQFAYNKREYFVVYRKVTLGDKWFNGTCYIDAMNKDAVKEFLQVTHEEYKKRCRKHFGDTIPGIFTDEPVYLRKNSCLQNAIAVLPWTDVLPHVFFELKGYSINEHLKELFLDIGNYTKVRFDFFDVATQIFIESFTKQYAEWCEKNNLLMTGHLRSEDTLRDQTEWIGAAMPHYEYMQLPGIDKLGRNIEQLKTVKQVSSVAEQLGKIGALCESFGATGQYVSFLHRKWISDWLTVLGITYINHHLSLYSMRGERKRDFPPNFFYQQPWWNDEKQFSDYLARLTFISSLGKRDVEILVIHPISSAWSMYSPFNQKIDEIDAMLDSVIKSLIEAKFDFHFGDEIIMSKWAKVEGNKLFVGNYAYSIIVIPPLITLRESTVKLLNQFVENGGNVIIIRAFLTEEKFVEGFFDSEGLPCLVEGERRKIDFIEKSKIVNNTEELIDNVKNLLSPIVEVVDKKTNRNAEKIICQRRIIDSNNEIVFLANTDLQREIECVLKINTDRNVYAIDLLKFTLSKVPVEIQQSSLKIFDATFYPASSLCLLISEEEIPCENYPMLMTGVTFKANYKFVCSSNNMKVKILDHNTLLIDKVSYEIENKVKFENKHVSEIWYEYFYNLPENTSFKATYQFEVIRKPSSSIFVAIECAENLEKILINQQEIKVKKNSTKFNPKECYLDINFTKIDITDYVREGTNQIVLEGKKSNNIIAQGCHLPISNWKDHKPTEIEAIYVLGDFSLLEIEKGKYAIDLPKSPTHIDITKDGYPFYTGTILVEDVFEIDNLSGRYFLQLNCVEASSVKVYVNKEECGIVYWEPYIIEITHALKKGKNYLEIFLTNTLFNLLGPNNYVDTLNNTFVRPRTFVQFDKQTKRYILLPFGISNYCIIKI